MPHVKLKILVIEDQADVATTMAILLRRVDLEVAIAGSGIEGIRLARQEKFDLITMDIDLPDMSGFDVCACLKQDFRFLRTPIIFISGRSTEENRRRAFELGAADFILKPFDPFIFVSRILVRVNPVKN